MRKMFDPNFEPASYKDLAQQEDQWRLRESVVVPPLEGRAFVVKKGEVLRVGQPEGPQVCDFNAFNAEDATENFWSGRTRILEAPHLTTMNRLWSMKVRPMFTIIADTVAHSPSPRGGRSHDLIFARCSRELWELVDGSKDPPNCQDNLAGAIEPFGLTPQHVHDAFNLFMKTGIDPEDRSLFYETCESRKGDHVDLYAEMECIVALSACPCGDGSDSNPPVYPLQADIFEVPRLATD